MASTRTYLLTLKDPRTPAPADVAQVERCATRIVDGVGRTLKMEAPDQDLGQLSAQLPSWHVQTEIAYQVPDTRRYVQAPPPKTT